MEKNPGSLDSEGICRFFSVFVDTAEIGGIIVLLEKKRFFYAPGGLKSSAFL